MAFSIYKPGQGYWTRVLTAIGAGALVLASVAWLWSELDGVDVSVNRTHVLEFRNGGDFGDDLESRLTELGIELQNSGSSPKPSTNAIVDVVAIKSAAKNAMLVRKDQITHVAYEENGQTSSFLIGNLASLINALGGLKSKQPFTMGIKRPHNIVLYIQAGTAVLILGVFALLLWITLNKPKMVDFMIATEAEMKKVNWPSRQEIIGSTIVVVCGTFLLVVILFTVNIVFGFIFKSIHILEG